MSSHPSSRPLTSCFSRCAPVYFVPLFLKLRANFVELGEEDYYRNASRHPLKPVNAQPRTKSTLTTPFLALVFSLLITLLFSPLLPPISEETKLFPRNSYLHFQILIVYLWLLPHFNCQLMLELKNEKQSSFLVDVI